MAFTKLVPGEERKEHISGSSCPISAVESASRSVKSRPDAIKGNANQEVSVYIEYLMAYTTHTRPTHQGASL